MTPIAQRKCAPSGVAIPGRTTGFVSPSSSAKTSLPETAESGCANKGTPRRAVRSRPKNI